MSTEAERQERLLRQLMYTVGAVIIVFFLTVGGCTMHGNAYQPEVEKEYTEQMKIESAAELQRIKAVQELIDQGVNPVAARCAIRGWNGSSAGERCERAAR